MITTGALVFGDRNRFLRFNEEEHPLAFQIGGSDPKQLAVCAKWVEEAGYDELNLNCGCPSERVQKGAFGACLMAEPLLVADCVKAMRDACGLDITVKHRIGLDHDVSETMVSEFIGKVSEAGCHTFIVHARNAVLKGLSPKENRDIPPLRYDVVKRMKQHFPHLQFVLNGGIKSVVEIQNHLQWADGCMIGREAYSNPWFLSEFDDLIAQYVSADSAPVNLSTNRFAVIHEMQAYAQAQLRQGESIRNITKSWLGLFHGQPGGRLYRQVLSDSVELRRNSWGVVEDALSKLDSFI